ncbi:MAG: SdpI family protein [Candidatus Shapirobacteria bacterium]|nr:SdpI family protein [Candidatus Shapirobacteria bacterium]
MKLRNLKLILSIVIIFVSFILAIYLYPQMPFMMVTHWGIDNQPNGYSTKNFALFFMPILSIFLLGLFLFLPKIDPYKNNFKQFSQYYDSFILLMLSFLFYIYVLSLFWNLNYRFNMIQLLSPALAAMYFYAGVLTSKAKRNWFVGIRTPWTMSNETVWQRTHQIGSKLFKFTGVIALLSIFWPQFSIFLILIPVLISSIFVFVYSYWEYRKIIFKKI